MRLRLQNALDLAHVRRDTPSPPAAHPTPGKTAEIAAGAADFEGRREYEFYKPFRDDGAHWWLKWATIRTAFTRLGLRPGATVLDVGCGPGWTTSFLAESGFVPTGVDIAPGRIAIAESRARRWNLDVELVVDDMEALALGRTFDAALVFDALHHSDRPDRVVARVAEHLRPGGWVLFGEPSVLHAISPSHARRTALERGWVEHGVSVRALRGHCRSAGLDTFRRFYESTAPYEGRVAGFGWQALRLAAANLLFAPQASVWLAARKP